MDSDPADLRPGVALDRRDHAQADRVPVGPLGGYADVLERGAEQLVHPLVALEASLQLVDGERLADQPLREARDLSERRHVLEDEQTTGVDQVAAPLVVEPTRDCVNRNAQADRVVAHGLCAAPVGCAVVCQRAHAGVTDRRA